MKKIGRGIGLSFYGTGYGNGFPDVSKAIVRLLGDGRVGVCAGATEVGQGSKTIMRQIAAETLKLDVNLVDLICEDTNLMPDSGTAAASRQTYNTGNAIKLACEDFKKKLIEKARVLLDLNSTVGLQVKDSAVYLDFFPQKNISFKDISENYSDKIEGEGIFTAQTVEMDAETGQGAPYHPYTYNACAVEVEVDVNTGKVEVLNACFAQDVGKAVNPKLIEGQIDGGFTMALGYALFEDLNIVDGKMKHNKFSKYLIPTSMDTLNIEKVIVEDPESTAPYGAKGIGEPVMIPVAPAILNAIYDAIGVRVKELPVTPERLFKAIKTSGLYETSSVN